MSKPTIYSYRTGAGKKGRAYAAGIAKLLQRGHRLTVQREDRVPRKSARDRVLDVARAQLGVIEAPRGSNSGPQVERYQQSTTVPGTGWPWCMAFVVWCCLAADVEIAYRGAYVPHFEQWARDNDRWSASLPRAWRNRVVAVVMEFGGDRVADHVGLLERGDTGTIEGNTSGRAGGSQTNGDGVFRRDRDRGVIRGYVLID